MSSQNNLPKQILVIDNDETVARGLKISLGRYNILVNSAVDLDSALFQFTNESIDCVLIENDFQGMNAVAMIQKFRVHKDVSKRSTGFIVISGKIKPLKVENMLKELMEIECLIKPFSDIQVLPCISRSYSNRTKMLRFEKYRETLMTLCKAGKGEEAFKKLQKDIKAIGKRGVVLGCEILTHMKRFEIGIKFVDRYLDADPSSILFKFERAKLMLLMGKRKEANEVFEEVYGRSPLNVERLKVMAENYVELGRPDDAIEKMRELLDLSPDDKTMKFKLFRLLHEKNMREQAETLCKESSKPMEVIRYYNNSGVEFSKKGDFVSAIKEYEMVVGIYPNHKEVYRIYYNLALAYKKAGVDDLTNKMIKALENSVRISPDFAKAKEALRSLKTKKSA